MQSSKPATTDNKDVLKVKILPEHSKEYYIQEAWISLAREDAPLEVFEKDFGEVREVEQEIYVDDVFIEVSFHASIGYDREEPYVDYETYYENEPYITTETYYDSTIGAKRTREVTKYRKVQRQRQVTKYKKVTDWSTFNSNISTSSLAVVGNKKGTPFYEYLFNSCLSLVPESDFIPMDDNEGAKISISQEAEQEALKKHLAKVEAEILDSLPGDHYKDLSYNIDRITGKSTLIKTVQYEADISFADDTYTRIAFPFGSMTVGGIEIENDESLYKYTEKLNQEKKEQIAQIEREISPNIWQKTNKIVLPSFALLLLSIITSLFIHVTFLVVTAFILAALTSIYCFWFVKQKSDEEKHSASLKIQELRKTTDDQIKNYTYSHKSNLLKILNKKLNDLGFEPAEFEDIGYEV